MAITYMSHVEDRLTQKEKRQSKNQDSKSNISNPLEFWTSPIPNSQHLQSMHTPAQQFQNQHYPIVQISNLQYMHTQTLTSATAISLQTEDMQYSQIAKKHTQY